MKMTITKDKFMYAKCAYLKLRMRCSRDRSSRPIAVFIPDSIESPPVSLTIVDGMVEPVITIGDKLLISNIRQQFSQSYVDPESRSRRKIDSVH